MRTPHLLFVLAISCLCFVPLRAFAEARLLVPPSRSLETSLTTPPCGSEAPTVNPTVYFTGEQATVQVLIEQANTATYRFFLLTNEDTQSTMLATFNSPYPMSTGTESVLVELPAGVTCTNCTLQMQQTSNSVVYYSCADISILDPQDPSMTGDGGLMPMPGAAAGCSVTTFPQAIALSRDALNLWPLGIVAFYLCTPCRLRRRKKE